MLGFLLCLKSSSIILSQTVNNRDYEVCHHDQHELLEDGTDGGVH